MQLGDKFYRVNTIRTIDYAFDKPVCKCCRHPLQAAPREVLHIKVTLDTYVITGIFHFPGGTKYTLEELDESYDRFDDDEIHIESVELFTEESIREYFYTDIAAAAEEYTKTFELAKNEMEARNK